MRTHNTIARKGFIAHLQYSFFLPYPLFLVMLLSMLAGCENGSSPTAPFSEIPTAKEASSSGVVLHAILVVDTDEPGELGKTLQSDLDNMNSFLDWIAASTGMGVQKQIYSGSRATIANLNQAVENLNTGPDDAIIFYFSGHGGRSAKTSTQWPNMYLQQGGVNLYDVFSRLKAKGSRLVLALSDSCNVAPENVATAVATQQRARMSQRGGSGYVRLFLESRAAIIASSSIPGEVSFANVFTDQLLRAMSSVSSTSAPSWNHVMDSATRLIQTLGIRQQPQYAIY